MPPYTCQICRKSYTRHDSLSRHMKARHSEKEDDDYEQRDEESDVKTTKRYDFLGHFNCHKCGQEFGTRESLERHIMQKERNKKNHSLFEQFECVHCVKVFPTQEALDNHVHQMHQIRQKDLEICKSTITFKHPFTMIVAGPTRSGKTTWVAKLIQNRLRQIKPTHPELYGVTCTGSLCTAT